MSHDHTPCSPATDQLRASTARFLDTTGDVLHDLDHLAVQLGSDSPTWTWSTEFDYRTPAEHLPMLVGNFADQRPAATRQWARALGLTPTRHPVPGTVAYDGDIDGLKIGIWTIVDKAAYGRPSTATRYISDILLTALVATTSAITAILLTRHIKTTTTNKPRTR